MSFNAAWLELPLSELADLPVLISPSCKGLKTMAELQEYGKVKDLSQRTREYLTIITPGFQQKRQDALSKFRPLSCMPAFPPPSSTPSRAPAFPPAHISEVGDGIAQDSNQVDGEDEEEVGGGEGGEAEGDGDGDGDGGDDI